MSLADLKKELKKKNKKKLEDKGYASSKDERFYIPSVDENDKVNVKIRLLPSYVKDEDGTPVSLESYISVNYHNISNCGKDKRWIPKTLCRKSIGEKCAICDHGSEMFNDLKDEGMSKSDAGKKAGKWWSDAKFITNIMVLEDKENPDNVGKVFLFEINKQIMNNIKAQSQPDDFETDYIDDRDLYNEGEAFDAWDLDESFVLHLSRTAGEKNADGKTYKEFPSWGKSRLMVEKGPEELEDQEEILEGTYDLSEFKDEKNYPSYDDTVNVINFLTYETDSINGDSKGSDEDKKSSKKAKKDLSETETDEDEVPEEEEEAPKKKSSTRKKKVEEEPEPDEEDDNLLSEIDDLIND